MITKVEPFMDDFNDGNYTGWTTAGGGSWTAANTYLEATGETGWSRIYKSTSDADNECVFRYRFDDLTAPGNVYIYPRFVDSSNHVYIGIYPNQMRIGKTVSGTGTVLQYNNSATSAEDTWYNVRIVADGASVKAWRWADGQMPTQVLSSSNTSITTTANYRFEVGPGGDVDFDDIRIHVDDLSNTTTFAVNNANELTTMTDPNGTTTFTFDPWGRMTSETRQSLEAMYEYNYGQMLIKVQTNFPGASGIEYQYRADGLQRSITENNEVRLAKYGRKGRILNEVDSASNLLRTFIADLAHVDGNDPAEGTITFNEHDIRRSIRTRRTQSKSLVQFLEFSPFGAVLFSKSVTADSPVFAGLTTRNTSGTAHARLRFHFPRLARWSSRDLLSMLDGPNLYSYARNNPVSLTDPLGLSTSNITFCACMLPNLMTSPLPLPTINDVKKNVAKACHMTYWEWREKVTKGGEWDYYSTYMRNCPEYVITFGHGDYLEEISNYNMGATGYAVGIDYAWLFLASIVLHFLDYRLLHWNNERKDCTDIGRGYVDANKWLMRGEVVP